MRNTKVKNTKTNAFSRACVNKYTKIKHKCYVNFIEVFTWLTEGTVSEMLQKTAVQIFLRSIGLYTYQSILKEEKYNNAND